MDRREVLQSAISSVIITGLANQALVAAKYFPKKVNHSLFEGINQKGNPLWRKGMHRLFTLRLR